MYRRICLAVVTALLLSLSGAALSYALTPADSNINVGDEVRFSLTGDYEDFLSFDLNVHYDPTVLMPVYTGVESSLSNLDDIGAGSSLSGFDVLANYIFADNTGLLRLSFSSSDPLETGSSEIAYFTFKAIGEGMSFVETKGIDGNFCQEEIDSCLIFIDPQLGGEPGQDPIEVSAKVTVGPAESSVPLPGALYLMLVGLAVGSLANRLKR